MVAVAEEAAQRGEGLVGVAAAEEDGHLARRRDGGNPLAPLHLAGRYAHLIADQLEDDLHRRPAILLAGHPLQLLARHRDGHGEPVDAGVGADPGERAMKLTNIGADRVCHILEHLRRHGVVHLVGPPLQDGNARLEVGRGDVGRQPHHQA